MDDYYDLEKEEGESIPAFLHRSGWTKYFYEMLLVDFLILNRDRHGANIEVLRNKRTGQSRLAPLFDHGLSLIFQCRTENDAKNVDPMEDKPV